MAYSIQGFPGGSVRKESACNAGDAKDMGSIPGSGRSPGGGMAIHLGILAWRIPRTVDPSRLQSIGCKESDMTEATEYILYWRERRLFQQCRVANVEKKYTST